MPTYETVKNSTNYGATVTSGAANTKGSYTQLTAATSWDSSWQLACFVIGSGTRNYLADFAKGSAASEVVFLANVYASNGQDIQAISTVRVESNVDIASGTRIAARCQDSTGSGTMGTSLVMQDRALGSYAAQETYGAVTGSSRGTQIDPGGSANTYSAYSEMTSATAAAHAELGLAIALNANTAPAFYGWAVAIATGAAASEVVKIPDVPFLASDLGGDVLMPGGMAFTITIAAGTRIAVKGKCSGTDATDRLFNIVLYGSK